MRRLAHFVVLSLLLAAPTATRAMIMTFDSRDAWTAAVTGSIYTETFDGLPDQTIAPGGNLVTPFFNIVIGDQVTASYIMDGGFYGDLELTNPGGFNEIVFAAPVLAFGVDVTRIERNFPTGLQLTVAGETFRYVPPPSPPSDPTIPVPGFFGAISDTPFSTVLIEGGSTNPRFYTLDNVSFAPVPEPAEAALLLVGSALLLARAGQRDRREP